MGLIILPAHSEFPPLRALPRCLSASLAFSQVRALSLTSLGSLLPEAPLTVPVELAAPAIL